MPNEKICESCSKSFFTTNFNELVCDDCFEMFMESVQEIEEC